MSAPAGAEKAFAEARDSRPAGGMVSWWDGLVAVKYTVESGECASCGKHCRGMPDKGGRFWHTACVTLAKSSPF